MGYREVNFDGLIGPTHNYAGLSFGNMASATNAGAVSNPREAALQGLGKMRALIDLGLTQGFLPPLVRPDFYTLRALGFSGSDAGIIENVAKSDLRLLANCYAASSMWTANAATVAPSPDTPDGKVHFTPANLAANFHRAIEIRQTARNLQHIFDDETRFVHHPGLPGGLHFGDEGAANHGRFAVAHGDTGVQLFIYGEDGQRFPARQKLQASKAVARSHGVEKALFIQQSTAALDAGAFHNDVVSVANLNVLFAHEQSFEDREGAYKAIKDAAPFVEIIEAPAAEVSLQDAISSYLFNSQLVTLPGGEMALILPREAENNERTKAFLERVRIENNPINRVIYKDVRESMRNGGGPACLRLRVLLSDDEVAAVDQRFILDEQKIDWLETWIQDHYRDQLAPKDLADPLLMTEALAAINVLYDHLGLKMV